MTCSPARAARHGNCPGKTLAATLPVGTTTNIGTIVQVRAKKKYGRRYRIHIPGDTLPDDTWFRRDQFTLQGKVDHAEN